MYTRFFSLFGMALIPTLSALGQAKRPPFEGVWRTVQVTIGGPQAVTVKPGPNMAVFTGRHYSRIEVHTEKPRPVVADANSATAEQLREVWGPFVAEGGTYEFTGDQLTMHPIVAKNPAAMTADVTLVYSYKIDGETLTLTAQRDRNGPVAHPFTVKLIRIE